MRSDTEPAIVALCQAAAAKARLQHGIVVLLEQSPVNSSASNGAAECAVKRVRYASWAIASDFCHEHALIIFPGSLVPWLLQHSAESLSRHARVEDGRTVWERRNGRAFKQECLPFGEVVLYLPAGAASREARNMAWDCDQ